MAFAEILRYCRCRRANGVQCVQGDFDKLRTRVAASVDVVREQLGRRARIVSFAQRQWHDYICCLHVFAEKLRNNVRRMPFLKSKRVSRAEKCRENILNDR